MAKGPSAKADRKGKILNIKLNNPIRIGSKPNKFVYWTPRILSILFVIFLALMSLDVFEGEYGFWGTLLALFIHNIPAIILLIVVIISWRHEIVGGIGFILGGIIYIALLLKTVIISGFEFYYLSWAIQISGIAFLIGILFIIGWRKKTYNKFKIKEK